MPAGQSLDDLVICLPARRLLESFHSFRSQLNAKCISDAMWNLSRQIPDEVFVKYYWTFVQDEASKKLGQIQLTLLVVNLIGCLHLRDHREETNVSIARSQDSNPRFSQRGDPTAVESSCVSHSDTAAFCKQIQFDE